MIRRIVVPLAIAFVATLSAGAPRPTRAVDFVAPTYYVGHAVNDYAVGSPCASPDYWTDGDWTGGGAYDSDDDAIQDAVDNAASGSVIHICAGAYVFENEVALDEGESMTFEGDGINATNLDGDDTTRIFMGDDFNETDHGGILTLRDLSIFNAHAADELDNGGAVIADSLVVERVKIEESAGAYNGGALYAEANVTILDSQFSHNASSEDGAVLYAWSPEATINVVDSTFFDNEAGNMAGAIMAVGDMSIEGSEFEMNSSAGDGGAVLNTGDDSVVSIISSTFTENSAGGIAGAAMMQNLDSLTIEGTDFIENEAHEFGGAMNLYNDDSVVISNSNFVDNYAHGGEHFGNGNGGAIDACDIASFTSTDSIYESNHSTGYGGAIGLFGVTCNLPGSIVLERNAFIDNVSQSDGGALWFAGTLERAIGNRFIGNTSGSNGGAIFGGWCTCDVPTTGVVRGNRFIRNHASIFGGAVWLPGDIRRLERNRFRGNTAGLGGGALAIDGVESNIWRIVRGNFIRRNVADWAGGGIYLSCSSLRRGVLNRLVAVNRMSANRADSDRRSKNVYQAGVC